MAPFQDVYTGHGISCDGRHPSLSAYTSHHHLVSSHDSGMQPLSSLMMVSSMPQQSTHHHDKPGGDKFTTCESNLSAQSISPLPNEPNTDSLQPTNSYV